MSTNLSFSVSEKSTSIHFLRQINANATTALGNKVLKNETYRRTDLNNHLKVGVFRI